MEKEVTMYIDTGTKPKCSKCGTINHTETVTRDNRKYLRCIGYGHEKLVSVMTTTQVSKEPIVYTLERKEFNIF